MGGGLFWFLAFLANLKTEIPSSDGRPRRDRKQDTYRQRYDSKEIWHSDLLYHAPGINLFCLLLAFYRMYVFAVAHPPEA